MKSLNLNATQYFEAVARLGGVTRAAEELQVSPSAVSQQIRLLEQQLGVKLFTRSKQVLSLTIDGERLYQTTTRALQSIKDVHGAIVRQRENLGLSIRVSPSVGEKWLAPRLASFVDSHPDWHIRVDGTPNFTDFANEIVDLDIRYGRGNWDGVHVEHLLTDYVVPMCSPAYRDRLAKISSDPIVQLQNARLVDSIKAYVRWDQWLEFNPIEHVAMAYSYHLERSSMSIEVGRQGGGLILESATLAHEELKRGDLVPLSAVFSAIPVRAYWIVCPSRHLSRRPVRTFIDWLSAEALVQQDEVKTLLCSAGISIQAPDVHKA
ncbi:LysR substrate-binding domain-containing protein [Neorhizobium sp. JUb45]|uniref:LysR substrate-binding domain-containing protein n=1 Tax=unclassified Neorhizobium TaxID=2629175 RepID=UPI001051ACE9|nr:LysR substrate-binding domain-containing protein [Neorhizobium sp. JUb45]TCR02582.1 DNA-binding transcriptional LysR family regulator [Neorhizobium sp. JUb45]